MLKGFENPKINFVQSKTRIRISQMKPYNWFFGMLIL